MTAKELISAWNQGIKTFPVKPGKFDRKQIGTVNVIAVNRGVATVKGRKGEFEWPARKLTLVETAQAILDARDAAEEAEEARLWPEG